MDRRGARSRSLLGGAAPPTGASVTQCASRRVAPGCATPHIGATGAETAGLDDGEQRLRLAGPDLSLANKAAGVD